MDRDKASTLEGMLLASRMLLQAIADHVRKNVPDRQRRDIFLKIGTAMAELIDISRMIYDEYPQLNPYAEQEQLAEKMRDPSSSMEKATAAMIMDAALSLGKEISNLDSVVSQLDGGDEKEEFVQALGTLMNVLTRDVMLRLVRDHPELDPDR